KSPVSREVIRVVTPGTITEDALLDAARHNYLAALAEAGGALGLAWLDVSTGAFFAQDVEPAHLAAALARIEPGEILVSERLLQRESLFDLFAEWKDRIAPQVSSRLDSDAARRRLETAFGVAVLD